MLDKELNDHYERPDLPGFCVAIVSANDVLDAKGFGYSNILQNKKYSIQTNQIVGSVSRIFVGLAMIQTVDDKKSIYATTIINI